MNHTGVQAERLNELLGLLGMQPSQLASILQVSSAAVSQWRNSKTVPDRNALVAMSTRWHVSIDSLAGIPGTDHLEPSPSLIKAQALVTDEVIGHGNDNTTPVERLVVLYRLFQKHLPGLTREGWSEYLKCDPDRWVAIKAGARQPADSQYQGAAFFAGWRNLSSAWELWLSTGDIGGLIGPSKATMERIIKAVSAKGGGLDVYFKTLAAMETK